MACGPQHASGPVGHHAVKGQFSLAAFMVRLDRCSSPSTVSIPKTLGGLEVVLLEQGTF